MRFTSAACSLARLCADFDFLAYIVDDLENVLGNVLRLLQILDRQRCRRGVVPRCLRLNPARHGQSDKPKAAAVVPEAKAELSIFPGIDEIEVILDSNNLGIIEDYGVEDDQPSIM